MPAPSQVLELVRRFAAYSEDYRSGTYNETQLRRDFLDPFFKNLGWDIDNEGAYAEDFRDVIHEDRVSVGGALRAPDYGFRISGVRKFFVEAKRPSVRIRDEITPAYQLRRYAWSAKLPLSILTDFEEFAIYDCRVKPSPTDSAKIARIFYCTYKEYEEHWDTIAATFSRQAVLNGSFDAFAEENKVRKGTAEVDADFLATIEGWRKDLAKDLVLRNPSLSQRELNFSVQAILDRIIFLRICEDRGIEDYERLFKVIEGAGVFGRLLRLFQQADARYNSGLFHFNTEKGRHEAPDKLTPNLKVDDALLRQVIRGLYYPESPYEFSVLSADILGQVYEQFLGKIIRISPGSGVEVDDKPAIKKAGGVFYTPTYVVNYIVRHTLDPLLAKKTPKQIETLRILDPSCGSGSFLIGAYQYLLDWYHGWFVRNNPEKWAKGRAPWLVVTQGGGWKLTTSARKRILLAHIHGVDIDSQAVEVTKLSLLLKVLEGETTQTVQRELIHERVLPDLGNNIKCGNALIDSGFYTQPHLPQLDIEAQFRVNVFDWNGPKGFQAIMANGGFDAIVGNPPWGAEFTEAELDYVREQNRSIIVRMIDSFMFFLHRCTQLLRAGGCLGMILPDVIFYQVDNQKMREKLLSEFRILNALNLGDVFHKVTRPACILVAQSTANHSTHSVTVSDFSQVSKREKPYQLAKKTAFSTVEQAVMWELPGRLLVTSRIADYAIWRHCVSQPHARLADVVDADGIQRGVSPDFQDAFLVDSRTVKDRKLERGSLRRVLTGGKHVKRYRIDVPDLQLIYTSRSDKFDAIPNICAYIDQFKPNITCTEVKTGKHPLYALHRPREEHLFTKPEKLIGVITEDEIIVALDEAQLFATDGLYLFGVRNTWDAKYIMGLLNSKLFTFLYRLLAIESGRVLAQVKPTKLDDLPVRQIDPKQGTTQTSHDRIVAFVDRCIVLHRQLAGARTPHEREALTHQVDALERQINHEVYSLYGLSARQIAIVEGHK